MAKEQKETYINGDVINPEPQNSINKVFNSFQKSSGIPMESENPSASSSHVNDLVMGILRLSMMSSIIPHVYSSTVFSLTFNPSHYPAEFRRAFSTLNDTAYSYAKDTLIGLSFKFRATQGYRNHPHFVVDLFGNAESIPIKKCAWFDESVTTEDLSGWIQTGKVYTLTLDKDPTGFFFKLHADIETFIGDIRLLPTQSSEMPKGWYAFDGTSYGKTSLQGEAIKKIEYGIANNFGIGQDPNNANNFILPLIENRGVSIASPNQRVGQLMAGSFEHRHATPMVGDMLEPFDNGVPSIDAFLYSAEIHGYILIDSPSGALVIAGGDGGRYPVTGPKSRLNLTRGVIRDYRGTPHDGSPPSNPSIDRILMTLSIYLGV